MRTGGCQCGSVRYAAADEPAELVVCHCLECQMQSASAFGISFSVPRSAFQVTSGEAKSWSRRTGSGGKLDCWFCPECGSRVWHDTAGEDTVTIKGGSLDEPLDLTGAMHIWTKRKLAGVIIPDGVQQFPGEPTN